jgi:hypothetical protein
MAFDRERAESVASRNTAVGSLILLVAVGLDFGLLPALATFGAIVVLFGLSLYARLPPPG